MPRYTPRNMDELRTCLGNCPADMPVEIERCVPVSARIVTELRSLPKDTISKVVARTVRRRLTR